MCRYIVTHITLLWLACLLFTVKGSEISFTSTNSSIKPLISKNLRLTCSLKDTSASTSLVGRRRREADDVMGKENAKTDHNIVDTTEINDDDFTGRSLTQTTDNMAFITSIIISKDGSDIASLTEHFPARAVGGASGFDVTGQLTGTSGEKGHLTLTWPHPTPEDAGVYVCDVDTLNSQGRSFQFSKTLSLGAEEASLNDLVGHLVKLELEKEEMQKTIASNNRSMEVFQKNSLTADATIKSLKKTVTNLQISEATNKAAINALENERTMLNQSISTIGRENVAFRQSLEALKSVARVEPDVFFSVGNEGGIHVEVNKTLIFNKVITNVGNGYDETTGLFHCPVSGYYYLDVHLVGYDSYDMYFSLVHNGQRVLEIYCYGDGQRHASNSVYLLLDKGDTVSVTANSRSYLLNLPPYPLHLFSGHLIALK